MTDQALLSSTVVACCRQSGPAARTPDILCPVDSASPEPETPICSAKGCREPAVWALRWNNPKLHTAERRKTWLACDAHREHLTGFLGARGFLRDVDPLP